MFVVDAAGRVMRPYEGYFTITFWPFTTMSAVKGRLKRKGQ